MNKNTDGKTFCSRCNKVSEDCRCDEVSILQRASERNSQLGVPELADLDNEIHAALAKMRQDGNTLSTTELATWDRRVGVRFASKTEVRKAHKWTLRHFFSMFRKL